MAEFRRRVASIDRRGFLFQAAGAAAGVALREIAPVDRSSRPTLGEGIYTDSFTYRRGDPIHVHASLADGQWVDVELLRHDLPVSVRVGTFPTFIGRSGVADDPGVNGARFAVVQSIDTAGLAAGIYEVRIPPAAMRPENRTNEFNGFPSDNSLARFVVTAAVPGSESRILWLHDTLTATCYGSFGSRSIYGPTGVIVRTVSYDRPGLDRGTIYWYALRLFREGGFDFEFIDTVALTQAPSGFLSAYDLVVMVGQFEYIPHALMVHLRDFVDDGGNIFAGTWEFSTFRTRLDTARKQATVYKWDFETADPLYGSGDPEVTGVAMNVPGTIRETELLGQTIWAGQRVTEGAWIDLPLYNTEAVQPFLEGTGLGPGAVLPAAFRTWGMANRVAFEGVQPVIVDAGSSGTPAETVIWAAVPSPEGRAWWEAAGRPVSLWPYLDDGHAIATYQERTSGARIVSLPSSLIATHHCTEPLYRQLLLNIVGFLAS